MLTENVNSKNEKLVLFTCVMLVDSIIIITLSYPNCTRKTKTECWRILITIMSIPRIHSQFICIYMSIQFSTDSYLYTAAQWPGQHSVDWALASQVSRRSVRHIRTERNYRRAVVPNRILMQTSRPWCSSDHRVACKRNIINGKRVDLTN